MNKEPETKEVIKEVSRTVPCECNGGKAELIKHDPKTKRFIYYCVGCDSYTYV